MSCTGPQTSPSIAAKRYHRLRDGSPVLCLPNVRFACCPRGQRIPTPVLTRAPAGLARCNALSTASLKRRGEALMLRVCRCCMPSLTPRPPTLPARPGPLAVPRAPPCLAATHSAFCPPRPAAQDTWPRLWRSERARCLGMPHRDVEPQEPMARRWSLDLGLLAVLASCCARE